jgi:hypothetical protein
MIPGPRVCPRQKTASANGVVENVVSYPAIFASFKCLDFKMERISYANCVSVCYPFCSCAVRPTRPRQQVENKGQLKLDNQFVKSWSRFRCLCANMRVASRVVVMAVMGVHLQHDQEAEQSIINAENVNVLLSRRNAVIAGQRIGGATDHASITQSSLPLRVPLQRLVLAVVMAVMGVHLQHDQEAEQ